MALERIGRHKGYWRVVPDAPKAVRVKSPKPISRRAWINAYAAQVWKRYGDMFGDWAVSGMDEEERDRYIGGGDPKLDHQARESMEEGLSDAIQFLRVPDDLAIEVRRAVLRLSSLD